MPTNRNANKLENKENLCHHQLLMRPPGRCCKIAKLHQQARQTFLGRYCNTGRYNKQHNYELPHLNQPASQIVHLHNTVLKIHQSKLVLVWYHLVLITPVKAAWRTADCLCVVGSCWCVVAEAGRCLRPPLPTSHTAHLLSFSPVFFCCLLLCRKLAARARRECVLCSPDAELARGWLVSRRSKPDGGTHAHHTHTYLMGRHHW